MARVVVGSPAVIRRKWKEALRANPRLQYRSDYFEETAAYRNHKLWKPGEAPAVQFTGRCCAMGLLSRVAGVEKLVQRDCERHGLRYLSRLAGLKDGEAAEIVDMNDVWNMTFPQIAAKLDEWHPEKAPSGSRERERNRKAH